MARTLLLALSVVLLSYGVASAQLLEVEGRYWFTDLEASAKVDGSFLEGTRIDFKDDLGIGDENLPELRVKISLGPLGRLRAAYTQVTFEGSETLGQTITFDDTTFAANMGVDSELELHYARFGWIWQFPVVPGVLRIGPVVEVKGILAKASIETRDITPKIDESATLPLLLPTLGLALDLTPHRAFHLFAEASGLPAGDLGYVVDAEAGIRVIPIRFLSFSAGYRIFDVRVEDDDDFGKFRLSGPFVGASLRF